MSNISRCIKNCIKSDTPYFCYVTHGAMAGCFSDWILNRLTGVKALVGVLGQCDGSNKEYKAYLELAEDDLESLLRFIRYIQSLEHLKDRIRESFSAHGNNACYGYKMGDLLKQMLYLNISVGDTSLSVYPEFLDDVAFTASTPVDIPITKGHRLRGEIVMSCETDDIVDCEIKILDVLQNKNCRDKNIIVGCLEKLGEPDKMKYVLELYRFLQMFCKQISETRDTTDETHKLSFEYA